MSGSNLETRSLLDELRNFEKGYFFDLGHPLLNRIAESFVSAAGIGAVQAVSREAYFTAVESVGGDTTSGLPAEIGASKKHSRFPDLRDMVPAKILENGQREWCGYMFGYDKGSFVIRKHLQ